MANRSVWLNGRFMIDLYVLIWGGRVRGMILFCKSGNYVTEVGLWIAVALPVTSVLCCLGKCLTLFSEIGRRERLITFADLYYINISTLAKFKLLPNLKLKRGVHSMCILFLLNETQPVPVPHCLNPTTEICIHEESWLESHLIIWQWHKLW